MSYEEEYRAKLARILDEDPRYRPAAYDFVRAAVSATAKAVRERSAEGRHRHISGRELLEGFRELVLERFGPLGKTVLDEWGIRRTEDVGSIVFNLVDHELLGATEEDSPEDFADGYDFREAFVAPFTERGQPPDDLTAIDSEC